MASSGIIPGSALTQVADVLLQNDGPYHCQRSGHVHDVGLHQLRLVSELYPNYPNACHALPPSHNC